MDRRLHLPTIALIAASALAGCGLFKTRNPVKANPVPVERCRNLTEPDSLVENITVQYGTLSGKDCYNSMIDNAFAFHPDPIDSSTSPKDSVYVGWNQSVETLVNSSIASSATFIATVFDSAYQDPTSTTSPRTETRYYAYHILLHASGQPDTTRYQGRAEITFAQSTGSSWSILEWWDRRDGSGLPTWGQLRADHRVGF